MKYYNRNETKHSAKARRLQDNWRTSKGYPIGTYKNLKGEYIELGNYVEKSFAIMEGANFLTKDIYNVVLSLLKIRKKVQRLKRIGFSQIS